MIDPPAARTVAVPAWLDELSDPGVRRAVLLIVGILGGFAVLGLGYAGVASYLQPPLEVPALLSGAFGGLGLIGACAALFVTHQGRRTDAMERHLLTEALVVANSLAEVAPAAVAASRRPALVTNGRTIHRASCPMANGRDLPALAGRPAPGLKACKRCRPLDRGSAR